MVPQRSEEAHHSDITPGRKSRPDHNKPLPIIPRANSVVSIRRGYHQSTMPQIRATTMTKATFTPIPSIRLSGSLAQHPARITQVLHHITAQVITDLAGIPPGTV